jgi:hypothetical protein
MKIILRILIVFLFFNLAVMRPTPSYAWWRERGYIGVNLGVWPGYYGRPYYPYYADPYYAPYYPGYAVASSPNYQPVVVNGVTYYVNNGVYYIYTEYGYQAVAAPAGTSVQAVQTVASTATNTSTDDSLTINIPNDKGGYTTVILKKSGKGYTGPQGEFYSDVPKVSQLEAMYGK